MKRDFSYSIISIADADANKHLTFVCDADEKRVKVESENNEKDI